MKTRLPRGLTALVLFALLAGAATAAEKETREFDFAPGKILEFKLEDGGSVEIEGWDENKVQVTYYDRQADLDDHRIEFHESKKGIGIVSSLDEESYRHSLHFTIRAPRRVDVLFNSMGGGLKLTGVEGEFRGKTMGGELVLKKVTGDVRLETMGGEIEVKDCDLDGKLSTMGGEVLFKNVVGDVKGTSMGGNIRYDNVRDRDGNPRSPHDSWIDISSETVLISSMGGGIEVDEAPEGADVKTAGGDIDIENASKFVKAWTGGGNVDIRVEDGWVDASTGGGDMWFTATNGWVAAKTGAGNISVEIDGGFGDGDEGVSLISGSGDMRVRIPADASIEFDIRLAYTNNSSKDYEIESDFEIDITRTDEWEKNHGTPRKYILGKGKVKGGKHKIKIQTVNGNVRIEKH